MALINAIMRDFVPYSYKLDLLRSDQASLVMKMSYISGEIDQLLFNFIITSNWLTAFKKLTNSTN